MRKNVKYKGVDVFYKDHLDGGGRAFGQQFVPVVKNKIGKVNHIFEFCSGPGFIGFSLLANNLCDKLTLADINPEAVEICKETIKKNNLESKVSVYLSDCLDNIPETEKWDLVVGNPPHFTSGKEDLKTLDADLALHKRFYKNIRKFLNPSGMVMLQENANGTSEKDFRQMIVENGLEVVDIFKVPLWHFKFYFNVKGIFKFKKRHLFPNSFYFIWSKLK